MYSENLITIIFYNTNDNNFFTKSEMIIHGPPESCVE